MIEEEIEENSQSQKEAIDQAVDLLLEKDEYDNCEEISLEIRPGVGGSESSLFSDDVFQMYQSFFSQSGWQFKITNYMKDTQVNKGCKLAVLSAFGPEIYKRMKCESGV